MNRNSFMEQYRQLNPREIAEMAQEVYSRENILKRELAKYRERRRTLAQWFSCHPHVLRQQLLDGCYSPVICWSEKQKNYIRKMARINGRSEKEMADYCRQTGRLRPHCYIKFNRGTGNRDIPTVTTETGLVRKAYSWETAAKTIGGTAR